MMEETKRLLAEGANSLGISLSGRQMEQFAEYLMLLREWDKRINLTSITDEKEIVIKHFLDSITCAATEYIIGQADAVDVGTGAGFPGIPLKIVCPDMKLTLVDSLNKRINFLKQVITRLGLAEIDMLHARVEDIGNQALYRDRYSLCFSRAVANLSVLCEYCLPLLKVGGFFLAMKGPGYKDEIKDARRAIEVLGGQLKRTQRFVLPQTDISHYILIIEKIAPTPSKYPRKPGKAKKKPIK